MANAMTTGKGGAARNFVGRLFFVPFLLAGVAIIYFGLLRPAYRILESSDWVEHPCVIQESSVVRHEGDDGPTYSVQIIYRYTSGGRDYESRRHSFGLGGSSSGRKSKQEVVDRYPERATRICYVDPDQPSEAVLSRKFTGGMWLLGLFGLPFFLIGVGGLFYKGSPQVKSKPLTLGRSGHVRAQTDQSVQRAALRLKPSSGPVATAIGVLLVALFWNGIVSVFVVGAVNDGLHGGVKWGMLLFLTPFILIGLALIVGALHQILAIWNPRAELMIDPGMPALGEEVGLGYVLTGSVQRLENLTLTLEAEERATYRRGTTTTTDTSTFHRQVLFEARLQKEIRFGRVTFAIPAQTMHSIKSRNNEIRWVLKVNGEIANWPDLSAEYPIRILSSAPGKV